MVGLGMFGRSIARELTNLKFEVLGVDLDESRTQDAESELSQTIAVDATDEAELTKLGPERRDVSVCAIGEESRDASIVCTALLRSLGSPRVVARSFDPTHERILRMVGAHDVVNPEREFGMRVANRLAMRGVLDSVPLGHGLEISEVHMPRAFVGKSLRELKIRERFGVVVAAVRRTTDGEEALTLPDPGDHLEGRDVLVLVARQGEVTSMLESIG